MARWPPTSNRVQSLYLSSWPPLPPVMGTESQRPKGRDGTFSSLNVAIEALNLAKEVSSVTPAKAVFGSVSILLTMIRVRFLPPGDEMFQVDMSSGLDG